MSELTIDFEMSPEARDLLFGSDEWWQHFRAAVAEGQCPRRHGRLEPIPDHEALIAGYCFACNLTYFTGGPDKEWAESGEAVGRTNRASGSR